MSVNKIKVLHLINNSQIGGAEHLLLWLARRYDHSAFEMNFGTLGVEGPFQKELKKLGEKTFFLGMKNSFQGIWARRKLVRMLCQYKPEILHTHLLKSGIMGVSLKELRLNLKIIHTRHYAGYYEQYGGWIEKCLDRKLMHKSPCIVAISKAVKRYLMEKIEIPASKIVQIYNGIDIEWLKRNITSDTAKQTIEKSLLERMDPQDIKIGVIGNFHPGKGHDILLKALPMILKENPFVRFILVGDDSRKRKFQEKVEKEGLQKQFKFLGYVKEIGKVFRYFDLLVIPSLNEGFGLVACEAMAFRVPVLASDAEGLAEIIEDNETGWIYPRGDVQEFVRKILRVMSEIPNERIVENAYQKVNREFSIQAMTDRLQDLYVQKISEK